MFRKDKWKEIVTLATPVVISKLSFTLMGVADTAMVGRLGVAEQGAVGLATTFMFTVYVFGLGVIGAVNTLVSQMDGARRHTQIGRVLSEGLRAAAVMGIATWLVLYFSEPLFIAAGLSARVSEYGYGYLLFRISGLFAVFGYWTLNAFLEGLGETRIPMWITLFGNLTNIVLNYVFIFGWRGIPAMGVEGAGLATSICDGLMFVCFAWVIYRKSSVYREKYGVRLIEKSVDRSLLRAMWTLGGPMGVQFFLEVSAYLVFSIFIGWVSDIALAAHQVALRVMSISFMTAFGIGTAATTLVGRRRGEADDLAAEAAGKRAVILMFCYAVACAVFFLLFPAPLAAFFSDDAGVVLVTVPLLYIAALFQVFDGVNMVGYAALKGAGDTRAPMYISVLMHWIVGVPLVYLLSIRLSFGVVGAWSGMCAVITAQGILMYLRFHRGRWKTIAIGTVASPSWGELPLTPRPEGA